MNNWWTIKKVKKKKLKVVGRSSIVGSSNTTNV